MTKDTSNVQTRKAKNQRPLSGYWRNPLSARPGGDAIGHAAYWFSFGPKATSDIVSIAQESRQLSIFDAPQYGEIAVTYDADVRMRLPNTRKNSEAPLEFVPNTNEANSGEI